MGIDLGAGYRAQGASDALLELVKQRMLEQQLQQQERVMVQQMV